MMKRVLRLRNRATGAVLGKLLYILIMGYEKSIELAFSSRFVWYPREFDAHEWIITLDVDSGRWVMCELTANW